jgi:hypothetical protein
VFIIAGGAVSWVSKLQTVVALSTTEAEYMAATQTCKKGIKSLVPIPRRLFEAV